MLEVSVKLQVATALYETHVARLRLRRGYLPTIDRLDVAMPASVSFDGSHGDEVVLELSGGEERATVFTGRLSGIRRSLRRLSLTAHNGGVLLAGYRPSMSLESTPVGKVLEQFCSDVDVSIDSVDAGPKLALYVADGRATALQELSRLAHLMGARASFSGEGTLVINTDGGEGTETAIAYGRELIDMESLTLRPDEIQRTIVGEGGGDPTSPEARWIIADFFGGTGAEPGVRARQRSESELRTTDDAEQAAEAWTSRSGADRAPVKLTTWLAPHIEPSTRLSIQGLPEHVGPSSCTISHVVHVIDAQYGAYSRFWGAAQSSGSSGLLAAAGGGF